MCGQNCPNEIAMDDTRFVKDWRGIKQAILKDYSFNLTMENSNFDYYCIKKIWDALS